MKKLLISLFLIALVMTTPIFAHDEPPPAGATFSHITYGSYPHSHRIAYPDGRWITYNFWSDINDNGQAIDADGELKLNNNGNPIAARHVAAPTNYKNECVDRVPAPDWCETGVPPVVPERGESVVNPPPERTVDTPNEPTVEITEPDPTPEPERRAANFMPQAAASTPEPVQAQQDLLITEYMMRDGGFERLPTWIELYNPNTEAINLNGYVFTWKGGTHAIQDFSIPPLTAVILATKQTLKKSGITDNQVYDLGIDCGRCLKSGWRLQGELIDFEEKHPAKRGWWKERESFQRYRHVNPEGYYYGRANDIGSPGFYETPAPAAPILIRQHVGMWANLKRR